MHDPNRQGVKNTLHLESSVAVPFARRNEFQVSPGDIDVYAHRGLESTMQALTIPYDRFG